MLDMMGSFYADELIDAAATLEEKAPLLGDYYDLKGVDYAKLGVDDAIGLMRGKTNDGSWIGSERAVKSGLIDRVESSKSDTMSAEGETSTAGNYNQSTELRARMLAWLKEQERSR